MAKAAASDTTALSVPEAATAIVALINSRSQSPWPHEIEAIITKAIAPAEAPALHVSELGRKLRADLARFDAWSGKDVSDADWDGDVFASDWDEIYRLEAKIPNPPRAFADVAARAELAYFGADKRLDNRTMDLDEGDCWEGPAARLIEAVLQFAGSDINAKAMAPQPMASPTPSAMPPLSPEHLQYREALTEIARFDDRDCSPGMSEEEKEAAVGAACEKAMALERKTWATPAESLADVLLRGEMALYNENGVMASLGEPEAYYDERSVAQLIRAVVDVLGGLHAR